MLRKTIFLFMLLMILLMSVPVTTTADDGREIHPWYNWPTYKVTPSDFLWITGNWGAGSPGAVSHFINVSHQELFLDGQLLIASSEAKQYWGEIHPATCTIPGCWPPNLPGSVSTWRYPLGTLTRGLHVVYYHVWFDTPVTDLGDWNGDGHPDIVKDWEAKLYAFLIVDYY